MENNSTENGSSGTLSLNFKIKRLQSIRCLVVSDSCDPVDYSPPGSAVHGILQARTLEWVAISISRGSS